MSVKSTPLPEYTPGVEWANARVTSAEMAELVSPANGRCLEKQTSTATAMPGDLPGRRLFDMGGTDRRRGPKLPPDVHEAAAQPTGVGLVNILNANASKR